MPGKRPWVRLQAFAIFAVSLLVTSSWAATNWHEKVLHSFGHGEDGVFPASGLIFDATGNLYGTTYRGGIHNAGTVFELKPNGSGGWTDLLLHSFATNPDGQEPWAGVIFDAAGNLYGTTLAGGVGAGTVFRLTPIWGGNWTERPLYTFDVHGDPDGQQLWAGLIFDASSNLYGTTSQGGGDLSVGTVFELTPNSDGSWAEIQLYSFGNSPDGANPVSGVIFDGSGNLYGTTSAGGTYGFGTVFELTPNGGGGWTETILHRFGNGTDAAQPLYGSLIFDAAGNLYGTTRAGGTYSTGTVFELTPNGSGSWTETVLYSFGNGTDGSSPFGSLTFDAVGNLYGTTEVGGTYDLGTVFELTPIYPCIKCRHALRR
jgi:uncharacterized repeat protein (TIGR03803 family)